MRTHYDYGLPYEFIPGCPLTEDERAEALMRFELDIEPSEAQIACATSKDMVHFSLVGQQLTHGPLHCLYGGICGDVRHGEYHAKK